MRVQVVIFLAIISCSRGCKPFYCGRTTEPVPAWPFQVKSTGCAGFGKSGKKMTARVDRKTGKLLERCCDMRHACLQICASSKKKCDSQFKTCAEEACEKHDEADEAD